MILRLKILVVLFIFMACAPANAEVLFNIQGSGTIYEAVDGDTFWVNLDNKGVYQDLYLKSRDNRHFRRKYQSVKMRLANVNTEESKHKDESRNTMRGKAIGLYMNKLTKSKKASFQCWDIGNYGRPICAISAQGVGDLGLHLIENGLSPYTKSFGFSPIMHKEYEKAEAESDQNN